MQSSLIFFTQRNNLYEIKFMYNADIVAAIKTVPSRQWVPESKIWTIHKDYLGWAIKALDAAGYHDSIRIKSAESLNVNSTLGTTTDIPEVDISNVPTYVEDGKFLYKHQIDFIKYALDRQNRGYNSGFLLADDPGLGKTLQACNLALINKEQKGFKHCLIICCINSSKYNWYADICKHTNKEYVPYILGSRYRRDGSIKYLDSADKLYDLETLSGFGSKVNSELPYFIICNIECLRYRQGKRFPITEAIISLINSGEIGMIVIDEIHKNASPSSTQGKQIINIKNSINRQVMWLPMTGTPIVNKPTDVYLPMMLVDAHNYTNYYLWCKQFCVYGGYGDKEIVGYKNIPMLKGIVQNNMLRRLKSKVLDLPDKIYCDEYVENTLTQRQLYQSVREGLFADRSKILASMNPLAMMMKLRQVNGSPELVDPNIVLDKTYIKKNAKFARILELIEDITTRGEKVVIFSNWVEPLRTLYKFISKHYDVACFTGTMQETLREQHKQKFMTDPNCKILVGTIGAAGTTHTFTAANNVIFLDEPWTATDKLQAIDRVHRIGTKKTINIYTLITRDTIDETVHNIIYTKEGVANYIVDNKLDVKAHPELLDILLK